MFDGLNTDTCYKLGSRRAQISLQSPLTAFWGFFHTINLIKPIKGLQEKSQVGGFTSRLGRWLLRCSSCCDGLEWLFILQMISAAAATMLSSLLFLPLMLAGRIRLVVADAAVIQTVRFQTAIWQNLIKNFQSTRGLAATFFWCKSGFPAFLLAVIQGGQNSNEKRLLRYERCERLFSGWVVELATLRLPLLPVLVSNHRLRMLSFISDIVVWQLFQSSNPKESFIHGWTLMKSGFSPFFHLVLSCFVSLFYFF